MSSLAASAEVPEDIYSIWNALVQWLEKKHGMRDLHVVCEEMPGAGRGLYVTPSLPVANRFAPPPPLISIPTSALLNAHTLRPHYPKSYVPPTLAESRKESVSDAAEERPLLPLTANQLLTLHLALHHPESPLKDDTALPPNPWALYLKSLPRTFHWHHPLTWLVRFSEDEEEGAKKDELRKMEDALETLVYCLPARAQVLLRDVERRFKEDVKVLKEVISTSPPFPFCPTPPLQSFLWAWLNINTRCLTFDLDLAPADASNDFTLSPLVDFANHSSSATPIPITLPEDVSARKATHYALPATEEMVQSHGKGIKTEVLLQYGPHDDAFLFAEYGFVCWKDAEGKGNRWNEIRVDDQVEKMFKALKGGEGVTKKRILEDEGYWGDFTLHLEPDFGHPSYRLLLALRLLHLPMSQVHFWRDVVQGLSPSISDANEESTSDALEELCGVFLTQVRDGQRRTDELEESTQVALEDKAEWASAVDSVRKLWEGTEDIAIGVKASVQAGVEFS